MDGQAGRQADRQTFCPFLALPIPSLGDQYCMVAHEEYLYVIGKTIICFYITGKWQHYLCIKVVIVYYLNSQD